MVELLQEGYVTNGTTPSTFEGTTKIIGLFRNMMHQFPFVKANTPYQQTINN